MESFPSPCDKGKGRKRKGDPEKWKRNQAKKERYSAKTLPKRLLCNHKKSFKCMSLKMSDIKLFFDNFYAQPDKLKQDAIILKQCVPKKQTREKERPRKLVTEKRGGDHVSMKSAHKKEAVMKFINSIPCQEPHYCRGHTKRYYLASELSINKLWKQYNLQATPDFKVKKGAQGQTFVQRVSNFHPNRNVKKMLTL
ncbi:unnamed protein product [Diatraea saccharalis]|uniref:Uncharacterized protein n=1 Tax=Diatraea saccharalis TaxID=40085 RepID=A0A9N9WHD4_9NEOP|nr:unnamed protein product [Diatraea saccharalis]